MLAHKLSTAHPTQNIETMPYDPAECMVFALTGMTSKERKSIRAKAIKFPLKLMYVLECLDYQDVITWNPDGTSFTIINPRVFEQKVLPEIFKQAKFASFQRKLTRWSFIRANKVSTECSYSHPEFIRGKWDMCAKLNSSDKDEMPGLRGTVKDNSLLAPNLLRARTKHISQLQQLERMAAVNNRTSDDLRGVNISSGSDVPATLLTTQGLKFPSNSTQHQGVTSSQNAMNESSLTSSLISLLNGGKVQESQPIAPSYNALKDSLLLKLLRERGADTGSHPLLGTSSSAALSDQSMLENLLRMRTQSSAHSMVSPYTMEHSPLLLGGAEEPVMEKIQRLAILPSHITQARSLLSSEGATLGAGALRNFDLMLSTLRPEHLLMSLPLTNRNPSSQQRIYGTDAIQQGITAVGDLPTHFNDKDDIVKRALDALERSKQRSTMSSTLRQGLAGNIRSPLHQQVQASLEAQFLAQKTSHLPQFN